MGESCKPEFFYILCKMQSRQLNIISRYKLLISKHILTKKLEVLWCRHHRNKWGVSLPDCTRSLQQLCHRRIIHLQIIISKTQTCHSHKRNIPEYRKVVPEFSNAFQPTFHGSDWVYVDRIFMKQNHFLTEDSCNFWLYARFVLFKELTVISNPIVPLFSSAILVWGWRHVVRFELPFVFSQNCCANHILVFCSDFLWHLRKISTGFKPSFEKLNANAFRKVGVQCLEVFSVDISAMF